MILGILVSIALARYAQIVENARAGEAYSMLSEIVSSQKRFYLDNYYYTDDFSQLDTFNTFSGTGYSPGGNFNYNIANNDSTIGYAEARRINSRGGRLSYWMCVKSGNKGQIGSNTVLPADVTCN